MISARFGSFANYHLPCSRRRLRLSRRVTVTVSVTITVTVTVTITVTVIVTINVTVIIGTVTVIVVAVAVVAADAAVNVMVGATVNVTGLSRVTRGFPTCCLELWSWVRVNLFLVIDDNSFQSLRWIHFTISSRCPPVKLVHVLSLQKTRVVDIKKGRFFPQIVGTRWYLIMSYPGALINSHLGWFMWVMVGFVDIKKGRLFPRIVGTRWYLIMSYPGAFIISHLGWFMWVMVGFGDLITSHIWEIRRSYFIQHFGGLLLRIPLLVSSGDVCNKNCEFSSDTEQRIIHKGEYPLSGFLNLSIAVIVEYPQPSLPILRRMRMMHELMDQNTTSISRVLCTELKLNSKANGMVFLAWKNFGSGSWMLRLSASYISMLCFWFYCFFMACLDGALLTLTTSVMAFVLLLQWWWKRILVEVWLWCDRFRGYFLRPLLQRTGQTGLVCQFFKNRPSYRWSASSPNLTRLSHLVSAIRRLVWLLLAVYPQLLVLYFYLAALPLLALTSYIDYPTCFGTFGFLDFLLCIMGINVIVNTYDINK